MMTESALRRLLINASRSRAIGDRTRLAPKSAVVSPLVFAAASIVAGWVTLRSRRPLAAALAIGGCAWLALRGLPGGRSTVVDMHEPSDNRELSPVDSASNESFPASDPPALRRTGDADAGN